MLRKAFLALSGASPFAAGPSPRNSPTADLCLVPSTPQFSGLAEVTGIYQDGKGPYLAGDVVEFAVGRSGVSRASVYCHP